MSNGIIDSLVDKVIKVDRGGPESRVGKLLSAEKDHITLFTDDDGIVYYSTQHIKSLTYNAKNPVQLKNEIPRNFDFIKADDFKSILGKLSLRWVKINRGGPETLEGVMDVVKDDFVTIVSNDEIIRVAIFHIRNISYGVTIENESTPARSNLEKARELNKQKKDGK